MTGKRVGFVGLGSQGAPMARRIIQAGFETTLWARRPANLEPFVDSGARTASTKRELGAASDVLCVCVVDDIDVDEVLQGDEGALAGLEPGATVVLHSTVHPDTCIRLESDNPQFSWIDAPVSGGGQKAVAGELLVMVGGDQDVLNACRPILESFANPIVHVGRLGTGQEAKLLNNALFAAHLGLAADAFETARSRGLDLNALTVALQAGSGRSYGAELVASTGYNLKILAQLAGGLLAKDVGILTQVLQSRESSLLNTAQTAIDAMALPE